MASRSGGTSGSVDGCTMRVRGQQPTSISETGGRLDAPHRKAYSRPGVRQPLGVSMLKGTRICIAFLFLSLQGVGCDDASPQPASDVETDSLDDGSDQAPDDAEDGDAAVDEGGAPDAVADTTDAIDAVPDDGPEPMLTVEEFCENYPGLLEEYLARCGFSGRQWFDCERVVAAARDGRIGIDARTALTCEAALQSWNCVDPSEYFFFLPEPCWQVFFGASPVGGPCYPETVVGDQCAGGYCLRDITECPGRCEPFSPGRPCNEEQGCGPEQQCVAGACVARLRDEEACTRQYQCHLFSRCIDVDPGVAEDTRCVRKSGLGEHCRVPHECYFPLVCSEGQCVATVDAAERCTQDSNCPSDHWCGWDPVQEETVCRSILIIGDSCNLDTDRCEKQSACVLVGSGEDRECVALGEEGDPCVSVACAQGHVCVDEVCELVKGVGESCEHDGAPRDALCDFSLLCSDALECVEAGRQDQPCYWGGCYTGLFCVAEICQLPAGEDEPCMYAQDESCEEGLHCAGSEAPTCRVPSAANTACEPHHEEAAHLGCVEGYYCDCFTGESCTCLPKIPTGEDCVGSVQCEEGACYLLGGDSATCGVLCSE
jgi:hypothetical protein